MPDDLSLGLQQRCEAERHLGRYLERIVTPEGYTGEAEQESES